MKSYQQNEEIISLKSQTRGRGKEVQMEGRELTGAGSWGAKDRNREGREKRNKDKVGKRWESVSGAHKR